MSRWDRMAEKPPIDIGSSGFESGGGDQYLSQDGSTYFLTGLEVASSDWALGWIDVATNTFGGYVLIADNFPPVQLVVSPDNAYAYTVRDTASLGPPITNWVYKIDLSDGSTVAIAAGLGALGVPLEITPDGNYLTYAAPRNAAGAVNSNIWKIRTSDMAVLATITSAGGGPSIGGFGAFTSDSATEVITGASSSVVVIDMATFTATSATLVPTGYTGPFQVRMSADDSTAWVAMRHSLGGYDVVIPFDIATQTWGSVVVLNTNTGAMGFALSSDESAILFAHVDDYWRAVEIATSTVLKTVSTSRGVDPAVGWHALAHITDTKFYIASTDFDYVLWIQSAELAVQVMRWH